MRIGVYYHLPKQDFERLNVLSVCIDRKKVVLRLVKHLQMEYCWNKRFRYSTERPKAPVWRECVTSGNSGSASLTLFRLGT